MSDVASYLRGGPNHVHDVSLHYPEPTTGAAVALTVTPDIPFNQLLPSWNVDVPEGAGFAVDARLRRADSDAWTAWYAFDRWGTVPPGKARHLKDTDGEVDVDIFRTTHEFDALEIRFTLHPGENERRPKVHRVAICVTNTLRDEAWAKRHRPRFDMPAPHQWRRRLDVPFRSQRNVSGDIGGEICSPTSTAMVMAYRGVDVPTEPLAYKIHDPYFSIFGNWARAVQAAYLHGVPGFLRRFHDWDEVKTYIAAETPVIASIKDPDGILDGAPYPESSGHLFVIVGFDDDDNVHVNDPAGRSPEAGIVTYDREQMEQVWFDYGAVGYVLEPKPRPLIRPSATHAKPRR